MLIHAEGKDKKTPAVPPPVRQYYKINDATVEKLAMMMEKNERCVLTYRDEIYGFLILVLLLASGGLERLLGPMLQGLLSIFFRIFGL